MRRHRLLTRDSGNASVESIASIVFIVFLFLGVVEVSLALYARNVLAAAAHEGARAAVELRASSTSGSEAAGRTVRGSAGSLAREVRVGVTARRVGDRTVVRVRVTGRLDPPGPLPLTLPVDVTATAVREVPPR